MWQRLGLRKLLSRDEGGCLPTSTPNSRSTSRASSPKNSGNGGGGGGGGAAAGGGGDDDDDDDGASSCPQPCDKLRRRLSRRVGIGLPRTTTFKRQESEKRDRLEPVAPEPRRAVSVDRHREESCERRRDSFPVPGVVGPRLSAPEIPWRAEDEEEDTAADANTTPTLAAAAVETTENGTMVDESGRTGDRDDQSELNQHQYQGGQEKEEEEVGSDIRSEWSRQPPDPDPALGSGPYSQSQTEDSRLIEEELEKRWILNLTMHFRDRSAREKFFVTYAERPTLWRRVTISCDYRNPEPDSLEYDLKGLWNQKDRCSRIYESLRESLTQIQFYDTVTNLKLETRDGRLHVHVTEDVNESIPYPAAFNVGHLPDVRLIPEKDVHFVKHESGFVYHVQVDGKSYIKKEIPGPDMVDEFLYEINALHELLNSPSVIQLEGIVVDDEQEIIKGLLIDYAEQGALVDVLYYDGGKGRIPWKRRERWARQIVQGLNEIHEAGYVQGDFTLSNIVLDAQDNAKIIDINRRGCPVGWEPPEIVAKLESKQRISMYIGVKTDIFQLGMTLWALATENDEPERQCRPLTLGDDIDVPDYYKELVAICMHPRPQSRLSAKELLDVFPRPTLEGPLATATAPTTTTTTAMMHSPGPVMNGMGTGVHTSASSLHEVSAFPVPVAAAAATAAVTPYTNPKKLDYHLSSQTSPIPRSPGQQSLDDFYTLSRYPSTTDLPIYASYITPGEDGRPGTADIMEYSTIIDPEWERGSSPGPTKRELEDTTARSQTLASHDHVENGVNDVDLDRSSKPQTT